MKSWPGRNVRSFFVSVYGVSALLFLPIILSGEGMASPLNRVLFMLITFVPSAMGVLFVYRTRNPPEWHDFWRRVFRWPRNKTKFALAGMLILPLMVFASFGLTSLLIGERGDFAYAFRVLTDWRTLLVFLFVELTFGAFSEELGWRGYALDELQSKSSALTSSLVLGFLWAFWHTPAFLIPGTAQYAMGGIFSWTYVFFLAAVTLGNIIITWAYNNTNCSILVAGILMHFTMNSAQIFLGGIFDQFSLPPAYWPILLLITTAVAGALVLAFGPARLRRGVP